MNKQLATLGMLGYLPAPGTLGSLAALPFAYLFSFLPLCTQLFLLVILTLLTFFCITRALRFFHKNDPAPIILDEFIGCLWLYTGLQASIISLIFAFILFRFFDISKIGIKFLEKIPGAAGVMLDDIAAAILAQSIVRMVQWLF